MASTSTPQPPGRGRSALLALLLSSSALLAFAPSAEAECVGPACVSQWRAGPGCSVDGRSEGDTSASVNPGPLSAGASGHELCEKYPGFWTYRSAVFTAGAVTPVGSAQYVQEDESYSTDSSERYVRSAWLTASAGGHTVQVGASTGRNPTQCCYDPVCYYTVVVDGATRAGDWVCMPVPAQPADFWGDPSDPAEDAASGAVGTVTGAVDGAIATVQGQVASLIATVTGSPYYRLATDPDGDGTASHDEVLARSDPASAASRPDTDDDGDGVQNRDEQTRAHAAGLLIHPRVRATASDRMVVHLGAPGSSASVTSPTGASLRVTYVGGPGPDCPGPLPKEPGLLLEDCLSPPAVVQVGFGGDILSARAAYDPSVALPASAFRVACTPPPMAPTATGCLVGAAVDGTWLLQPAAQGPRLSVQAKVPAGMLVEIAGKVFDDVAPDSGDVRAGGSGQNSRDALAPLRLWNWHRQAAGTTYAACSGGLVAPCASEGPAVENVASSLVFVGS